MEVYVKEIIRVSDRVSLIRLYWNKVKDFKFRPGQWVSVWCDDFKIDGQIVKRAFSIASCDDVLELCVSRGKGLSAHLQDLSPGSKVFIEGPFGMFGLRPGKKCIFIAGGVGISPFKSMIKQALDEDRTVFLVYSFKNMIDFIYRKELEAIDNPKFNLIITVTQGSGNCEHRRVPDFLHEFFSKGCEVYMCGPPGFVDAVNQKLLVLGQPKDKIFCDKWVA